jgi:hydrogenase maturation protease
VSNPTGPASSGASDRPPLAIIGCGNAARCDDGAGVALIRALRARQAADDEAVQLIDAGTAGMDVMFRVREAQRVVIVDACRSGSDPGAIFRLPAREAITPTEHAFTLHGLRWDHALYAGSRMFGEAFLAHTEVILIEAADIGFGLDLSPTVAAAVQRVADLLEPIIETFRQHDIAELRDGRLHLSKAICDRWLAACTSVALLDRDGQWWLIPLVAGAGGLQLKQRNARGDRVVEAQEFFRQHGLEDSPEPRRVVLRFDPERGGARMELV